MKWTSVRRVALVCLIPFSFAACDALDGLTDLAVPNNNDPDAERAIATAQDVEALITGAWNTYHRAAYWNLPVVLPTGADEYSASWGNFGMRDFSSEPRKAWNNSASYSYAGQPERAWYSAYGAISGVYDGLRAIAANAEFAKQINVERATAFGKFVMGVSHAWLAVIFDSAFVLTEDVDLEGDTLHLLPYPNVMEFALGQLQEARDLANNKTWALDATWIAGNALSGNTLAGWASAFYAIYLSQMARTPAEAAALTVPNVCANAAACWNLVETKATEGIAKAFGAGNVGGASSMGFVGDGADFWWHAPVWYSQNPGSSWARADYKTIGYTEAGAGKGYDAWLAAPVQSRVPFDLDVPDLRITPGPPPHTQFVDCGTYFCKWSPTAMDPARGTYHWSSYTGVRQRAWRGNSGIGYIDIVTRATLDLTLAEALKHQAKAGAAALVNKTRVAAGLPAAADADANLMDKIAYEALIENYSYCSACSYTGKRRWGTHAVGNAHHFGLLAGTQVHFAIPGAELEVLQKVNYSYGGPNVGSALAPSAQAYCTGPVCGGGGTAVSPFGLRGGTQVPASHVHRSGDDLRQDKPVLVSGRATRYQ